MVPACALPCDPLEIHCRGDGERLRSAEGPFEAVEDEVEPEQVLVAVVVVGLQHVLEGQLGEVRELVGRESVEDRARRGRRAARRSSNGRLVSCRAKP